LETLLLEWHDVLVVAVFVTINPRHGDHVFRNAGDGRGIRVTNISPENKAAIQGRQLSVDGAEEVSVDRSEPALVYLRLGAACAQIKGLVRPYMQERTRKVSRDLR